MTEAELRRRYPRLYHVAEGGAWPSIRRHGLLSTTALLDRFEVRPSERRLIESERRPDSFTLRHPDHGVAVIRDTKPARSEILQTSLDGISPAGWFELLNGRVFFWGDADRASRLIGARANRGRSHDVLIIDTAALLERHRGRIALAAINTGAALFPRAPRRGRDTFKRLRDHDPAVPIVELTVDHAVPDAGELVVRVERWAAGTPPVVIWRRSVSHR